MQGLANYRYSDFNRLLASAGFRPLDLLVCGATGVGKSSTLNALFGRDVAESRDGASCCTQSIKFYQLSECLRLWDTPGFGDGTAQDESFARAIDDLLLKTCDLGGRNVRLIDMALLMLDVRIRNIHTPARLLKEILLPRLGRDRILLGFNQADTALCGRHWNAGLQCPDSRLQAELEKRATELWRRLETESGGSLAKPVCFSALHGFNLEALMDHVVNRLPHTPRPL